MSGRYLNAAGESSASGTKVLLNEFTGASAQKWKVVGEGSGYISLVPMHATSMALTVKDGKNADGTEVQITTGNHSDSQKFKLLSQWRGEYEIAAKCSKDKRVLTNAANTTADGVAVTIWGEGSEGGYHRQRWYLEPADLSLVSDTPEDGSIFAFRAAHSGQYLDVPGGSAASGTALQQHYYNGGDGQSFLLQKADSSGNYYLRGDIL